MLILLLTREILHKKIHLEVLVTALYLLSISFMYQFYGFTVFFFVSLFRKLWPLNYTLVQVKLPEKTS